MSVVEALLYEGTNGSISFGDYTLAEKSKVENYEFSGDLLKVKTYQKITKLEKNDLFLYESVPGTTVKDFNEKEEGISFLVEGYQDTQITVGLLEETEYKVFIDNQQVGIMNTHLSGKINISIELEEGKVALVEIKKI